MEHFRIQMHLGVLRHHRGINIHKLFIRGALNIKFICICHLLWEEQTVLNLFFKNVCLQNKVSAAIKDEMET